jgi:hypothetical protein
MEARQIATTIEIPASPERVWQILSDTPRYPEWNPFIVALRGELASGREIKFHFRIPPAPRLPGRATVLKATPGAELRWAGRIIGSWLFRAEHYHLLTPAEGQRTRLEHGELFSGMLAQLTWPLLRFFAAPVYDRFNQALLERVEQSYGGTS